MDPFLLPVPNVQGSSLVHRRFKEGEESKAGAPHGFGPSIKLCSRRYSPSPPRACMQNLLSIKGNRGSGTESQVGAAAVQFIKKHNGESQTVGKTKGETIWRSRRSLGSKTPEARKLAVDFAAGILCEQPGRNWQYVKVGRGESGRKGKSVPRRLRTAGKCHQGERSGTE